MKKTTLLVWVLLFSLTAGAQSFSSFKLNDNGNGYLSGLTAFKNLVIFQGDDGIHGSEPWVSDGTTVGTHMLKDILPGSGSSYPMEFTEYKDKLYFSADDSIHGRELWVTDGTENGTVMLADILPGIKGSGPNEFISFAGKLFFQTQDTSYNAFMYTTDGTPGSTKLFKTMDANLDVSVIYNGKLYFDGTGAGTGSEPWVSDGTEAGTFMLKDICTSVFFGFSSNPRSFTVYNGSVYFSATDSVHGTELWVTDGTQGGTHLFKDIDPTVGQHGGISSSPGELTVVNNKLLFIAMDALWASDGTPGGTKQLIITGTQPLYSSYLHSFKNYAYFFASDDHHGTALWRSDGTGAGTALFKDLNPTDSLIQQYPIHGYAEFNNSLYFTAEAAMNDNELFTTTGTAGGTQELIPPGVTADNALSFGSFTGFAIAGNAIYFGARYSDTNKLWRYGFAPNGVETINANSAIRLYPNPVSNTLHILGLPANKESLIEITDILGRQVYSDYTSTTRASIETMHLNNGIYFIRFNAGAGRPFIVNH